MSTQQYRYYRLDRAGELHCAEWLEASNDEEATAIIAARHADEICEVWHGKRLVRKLSPTLQRA